MRWFYRSEFDDIFAFTQKLQDAAQAALNKDAIAAEAYAESNAKTVWNYVMQAQEQDADRGISRIFEVLDPTAMTLRWCSPQPSGPIGTSKAARLRQRPEILKLIDGLDDREFEALGCVAMTLAGATKVTLTPAGNEGGVDFFALVPLSSRCHLFSGGTHPIRVIGQSKKYSGAVQPGRLKEFLQTIDEVKYGGEAKTEKVVPAWFRAARGPIVGMMLAHRGFQSGAESRARRHGVITASSLDLAETMVLSRAIPADLPGPQRAAECKSRIEALLA